MGQFQRKLKIMLYYISLACFFVVVSPKYVNPMVDIGLIEEVITINDAAPPKPVNIVDDTTRIPIRPVVDPSVGIEGVSISPFTNATSVFCGTKVDTFQAVIRARLRLHCGLAGSTTTVHSPTCVRGVIESLHSCSGLSRLDMDQCLANAFVLLDDVCGLPTHTPYGPIRSTLCNALFHIEDSMKNSVRTFCIADAMAREGRSGCGFWKWTECAGQVAAASISCCASKSC